EVDTRLPEVLEYTLAEFSNVTVIQGDCMKMNLSSLINSEFGDKKVSVAANLPYYITTPIITMLLENRLPLEKIVVMVQKEVAQRLCAEPGGKDYGAISVMCKYYTEAEIVSVVPAGCFVPAPKVDSAVVAMNVRKEPPVKVKNEKCLFAVIKAAFSQRRKTLCNCLSSIFRIEKIKMSEMLTQLAIEPNRRGETLSIEEFAAISDTIISEGLFK
ncbi:MAG: ribosomal RNA small subunit methyltransferase A, partial [Clostridia bacterium]|nr:ribosomal RNA small subunit methyltransferase A [Clostridia bacterium]